MVTPKAEHGEIFIVCQYIVILHIQMIILFCIILLGYYH